ncbi:MAG: sulfotransferase [Caulobacterales bacterium]
MTSAGAIAEPQGDLAVAFAHARRLLNRDPALAEEQAQEILKVVPGHPETLQLLAEARRLQGAAWRALGDQLTLAGDTAGADAAYAQHIGAGVNDPDLMEAALALCEDRLPAAERLLRDHLKRAPTDVAAIRMLAELATRLGRNRDAENLLARCLELAPSFTGARHNLAIVLYRQNKGEEALPHLEMLLEGSPRDPNYRNLMAATLSTLGEYARSIDLYESVLAEHPGQPKAWLSYGHALKTAGRGEDAVAAYRRAIGIAPAFGEAYWSLANLKTFRFSPAETAAMRAQLARADLGDEDRFHLDYALGKALEDAADYAASFEHYAAGAKLRRRGVDYDADETTANLRRARSVFTPAFFAERRGMGCQSPAPIFIVGLPRSGSTLVEQILASHSAVEGTMELPEIVSIARTLGGRERRSEASNYPQVLADLGADELAALGERFLEHTRIQRKSQRPFFIDKMPNNFLHIGLIQLILPNAKIIDARRHPLGACFSAFKQHFARGQNFSYDLEDLGRYYRDYAELMAHFDEALPGKVHRVFYETLVEDTEAQIRRLLDHCGLPFEAACLRFYENDRAVRTASSEQVRQPIYRDGLDQWRRYEPWLGPLKAALGPVAEVYPRVPEFNG